MNWIELNALDTLYRESNVKINETLRNSGVFNYLINSLKVLEKTSKQIIALPDYFEIYKTQYLEKFTRYKSFLLENDLLKPQIRFLENDIIILMKIKSWKTDGVLEELCNQILASDESLRGVSLMFFKNEKYLDNKPSLINALKSILVIDYFSNEKDQQYIYKLECYNPRAIVLCENLDFLTKPNKPRQFGIELWYAGGKNISKLDYADTRGLPIFYSCDWDYDGLFIIYPLVKEKIPSILLLTPNGPPKGIDETEHNSRWHEKTLKMDHFFNDYNHESIVNDLIKTDRWIIEESNNLIEMLQKPYFNTVDNSN